MQTVTITYTLFAGFAATDSLPTHVQVSAEFQLVTECSPAMLMHPVNPLLQFDFDLAEGWLNSDAAHTNAQVPAEITRQCIVKYRDQRAAEITRRASDYNSGVWTREEIDAAVAEVNDEIAAAELLHCGGTSEIARLEVR
jgi:hypothetical protein